MLKIVNVKRVGSDAEEVLFVDGDKILGWNLAVDADVTLDGGGGTIVPALIELHAHLREPGQEEKEDLASGLAAAAAGGYGTVVSMPNTSPVVDDPAIVRQLAEKAARLGFARLRPAAALTKGQQGKELAELALLKDAGAAMFTDDGRTNEDARVLRLGLEYASSLDMVVSVHAEDATLRADGVMHEGEVSEALGLPGNPAEAESARVARDIEIARLTKARLHVQHLSTARALDLVRRAKADGVPITCEVCPHHLTLTHEHLRGFDAQYKVAPPLRTSEDAAALLRGLSDGTVDAVGTDHAPHTSSEKERDLLTAPFGIPSIEVAFPLMYTRFADTLGLQKLVDLFTSGAARVMGWDAPTLEPGAPADLTILDLDTERAVEPSTFRSKAKFSPWAGEVLRGWPTLTLVAGRVAFQRGA
ncbi:dihydroorotase [Deinococcus yavapaiensis]|uniref:Dihydroorotase n=1 Tax=Deinococcus yavapaiensis KR-236 TaxID=694435 RepID=A0A318SG34_9DEIO|nr:dihydroorotase [Deinococcus yavapaiensis]PYE56344.1 dihydroorotase [Deinococcus yavapaiensis KR-236]